MKTRSKKNTMRGGGRRFAAAGCAALILIASLPAASFYSRAAAADESLSQATIELKGHAFFIRADDRIIGDIEQWAGTEEARGADFGKVKQYLDTQFGGRIKIEEFHSAELVSIKGMTSVAMTVREAVLKGRIPPIEGLLPEEALIVLEAFGFTTILYHDYNTMSDQEQYGKLYSGEGPLAALGGTGPFDTITLFYKESNEDKR
jgi:hypothetical protein